MQRTAKRLGPILAYAGLAASLAFGFMVITADEPHRAIAPDHNAAADLFSPRIQANALPPG